MYGFLIFIGILTSLLISESISKQKKLNTESFWGIAFSVLIFGIIGARIYHVIDYWEIYSKSLISVLYIWKGGLGIIGGIIGGLVGFLISTRKDPLKMRRLKWIDIFAITIPLGQAIGRFGNYFNNEHLPYAIYESFADLLLFMVLFTCYKLNAKHPRKGLIKKDGDLFFGYLGGYGLIRIILEPLRISPWEINGLNIASILSIVFLTVSIIKLKEYFNKKNLVALLAVFGIGISLWLTYFKITLDPAVCSSVGCYVVQTSKYSTLFGIPLGVFGAGFYMFLLFLHLKNLKKYFTLWLIWGLLYSSALTYIEIGILDAICNWCMASFVNIIVITILSLFSKE